MHAKPGLAGWLKVGLLLLTGVCAAFQVGKVAPIIDILGETFRADVGTLAWLSSTISIIGGTLGLAIGISLGRIGYGTALIGGILLMAAGCLLSSFSTTFPHFLIGRVIEGTAYIIIFVSIPGLIFRVAKSEARTALALWASAVPTGIVLAMLTVPYLNSSIGWRTAWQILAVCFVALAALNYFARGPVAESSAAITIEKRQIIATITSPAVLRLAWCFFAYAGIWFIFVTWTPYLLRIGKADSWLSIPRFSALVVGANVGGNLAGSFFISRGNKVAPLLMTAFAANLLASVYLLQGITSAHVIIPAAAFASLVSGVLPPAIMAAIGMRAKTHYDVAIGNSLIMQSSNLAALIMPPVFGFLYASFPTSQPAIALISILAISGLVASVLHSKS